jgi:hypothetical protein
MTARRAVPWRALLAAAALILGALSLWQLERARIGIDIATIAVGDTPVTVYEEAGADGPLVVIAHGFAGSRQMMQGFALTLARAGYRVMSFDFEGHGRHPVPMSGDVDDIDGTTQLLIDQTRLVADAGLARGQDTRPIAILGHSMATDIIIRTAIRDERIGPVIGISTRSGAVTATEPETLLMVTGEWEPGLRAWARDALAMVDPTAGEGATAQAGPVQRRAVVAPGVEHVAILHSQTAEAAALAWLDAFYGRQSAGQTAAMGPWILLLLASIVALAWPLAHLLPERTVDRPAIPHRRFAIAVLVPAIVTPLVAVPLDPGILPVLVADYLALHLLIYGALQLVLLRRFGVPWGHFSALAVVALLVWGLGVFGFALDRYAANFWPVGARWWIIAALALGAIPFMVADAFVTQGGRAPLSHRIGARAGFLASLGFAVALDFWGLFFLLMIAPVILLFYVVFGLMGRWVARRGGALSAGIAQGLILAWAIGVSFPLFVAGG